MCSALLLLLQKRTARWPLSCLGCTVVGGRQQHQGKRQLTAPPSSPLHCRSLPVFSQALDLVTSAVTFAPSPPPSSNSGDASNDDGDGGIPTNSGGGGRAARIRGGGGSHSSTGRGAAASNAGGESSCSSGSEGGLGSSWGSVSELASACVADTAHDNINIAGAGNTQWGGGGEVNDRADDDDDDDEDDEVVRKGIWFPPPSIAGAQDPLLASSTAVAAAGDGARSSEGSGPRQQASSPATGAVRITQATAASQSALSAPQEEEARRITKERGARSSPRSTSLAGKLRRWHRFGAARAGADDDPDPPEPPADKPNHRRRFTGHEGLDAPLPLSPSGGGGGGDGGEAGSEFVMLVSREATVRELAASVGEFPPEWLVEAFGLVVRRQVEGAVYDARARAAMKRAVRLLEGKVSWKQVGYGGGCRRFFRKALAGRAGTLWL